MYYGILKNILLTNIYERISAYKHTNTSQNTLQSKQCMSSTQKKNKQLQQKEYIH